MSEGRHLLTLMPFLSEKFSLIGQIGTSDLYNVSVNSKPEHPSPRGDPGGSHILIARGVGVLNHRNVKKFQFSLCQLKKPTATNDSRTLVLFMLFFSKTVL